MSRVPELLSYTISAIDGIEDAINSHFISTKNIPLEEYGDLIRGLKQGNQININAIPIKIGITKKQKTISEVSVNLLRLLSAHRTPYIRRSGTRWGSARRRRTHSPDSCSAPN